MKPRALVLINKSSRNGGKQRADALNAIECAGISITECPDSFTPDPDYFKKVIVDNVRKST